MAEKRKRALTMELDKCLHNKTINQECLDCKAWNQQIECWIQQEIDMKKFIK